MPSDLGVVFIVTFVVTTLIYLLFFSCSIIKWNYQIHGRNCRLLNDNRQVGFKRIFLKKKFFQVIKTRDVEQEKVMNNAEARQRYYEYVKKLLEKAKQEEQAQNKEKIKFE